MPHILIAGASGLVGQALVQHLTGTQAEVTSLTLLTRRPAPFTLDHLPPAWHAQWQQVAFAALDSAMLSLTCDVAFCCLGTTRHQAGSLAAQAVIDRDYVLAFARFARRHGARCLVVVSSLGADPHARNAYLRLKGEMEAGLIAQNWPHLIIARPSMLLGARPTPRLSERLAQRVYPLIRPLVSPRYQPITATQVARVLWLLAQRASTVPVVIADNATLHATG
ncbi:MAG: NAD(P)H-binding protein [Aeromonas sp.]